MTLPALSIPEIPLPLEIPELLHPAIVHFVIAIPIVVLLLELYNLGVKRRSISLFSLFLLIIVAVAMFGAYLTGGIDGKATWDILSTEGQAELKDHKLLGIYLVYASVGMVFFKLLFMAIRKTIGRVIFIFILGGFIAVTLNQGKEGGELVYKYGANNEVVVELKDDIADAEDDSDGDAASEKLKSALDELQTKYDALLEKTKEKTKKETVVILEEDENSTETNTSESNTSN